MNIKPSKFGKLLMPIFAIFNIVNLTFLVFAKKMDDMHIDHIIVIIGNTLLFLLAMLTLWMLVKSVHHKNPHVLVRTVMATAFIKMIIVGIAVFWYVQWAKQNRSNWAVIISMLLYLVYTFIEVKAVIKLNKQNTTNAHN